MPENNKEFVNAFRKIVPKIIAKAWADDQFRTKLLQDTRQALKEEGLEVPEGMQVQVVEDTPEQVHLVMPTKPEGEIATEDFFKQFLGHETGPSEIRLHVHDFEMKASKIEMWKEKRPEGDDDL